MMFHFILKTIKFCVYVCLRKKIIAFSLITKLYVIIHCVKFKQTKNTQHLKLAFPKIKQD